MLTVTLTITGEDLQMVEEMLEEAMEQVRQGRRAGFEGDSHSGYEFAVSGQVGSILDDDASKAASGREQEDELEGAPAEVPEDGTSKTDPHLKERYAHRPPPPEMTDEQRAALRDLSRED